MGHDRRAFASNWLSGCALGGFLIIFGWTRVPEDFSPDPPRVHQIPVLGCRRSGQTVGQPIEERVDSVFVQNNDRFVCQKRRRGGYSRSVEIRYSPQYKGIPNGRTRDHLGGGSMAAVVIPATLRPIRNCCRPGGRRSLTVAGRPKGPETAILLRAYNGSI